MDSLLNTERPPVYCPGCSHERVVHHLDKAFQNLKFKGEQIVLITDIGCSGLFDTFFHTHAFHGLHGRALTYAIGLKLAQPDLNVVVIMGDGGMGIGGAHLLAACRRNLDINLIVLNNFTFAMTGGQFSVTTPEESKVGSAFLNQIERPMDLTKVAVATGATYATRCSAYSPDAVSEIEAAINHKGFSIIDMWSVCVGRYTKQNKLTPKLIDENLSKIPLQVGVVEENMREEYGKRYREVAATQKKFPAPLKIEPIHDPPKSKRQDIVILGDAGQRVLTAGDLVCFAGLTANLRTTQKNEYNITVLRGLSISEVILSPDEIGYTGIGKPDIMVAIGQEGVNRRKSVIGELDENSFVLLAEGIELPATNAQVLKIDFKALKIKKAEWALASLFALAKLNKGISMEMLESALRLKYKDPILSSSLELGAKLTLN